MTRPLHERLSYMVAPVRRRLFPGSSDYWEARYVAGDDSGPGSYGELARFKAEVLNGLVAGRGLRSVLELGCGDGHQLGLAEYPTYLGLDVAPSAVARCARLFKDDPTKSFYLYSTPHFVDRARLFHADLALSLDVLFHLVEDEIFETYLRHLFAAADSHVVIYSSDEGKPDPAPHVRHRNFTRWVQEHISGWELVETISNPLDDPAAASDFHIYERR